MRNSQCALPGAGGMSPPGAAMECLVALGALCHRPLADSLLALSLPPLPESRRSHCCRRCPPAAIYPSATFSPCDSTFTSYPCFSSSTRSRAMTLTLHRGESIRVICTSEFSYPIWYVTISCNLSSNKANFIAYI